MPPTDAAVPDPNALAARALTAVGAQRDMPGLTAAHGWSLFGWLSGHGGWLSDALLAGLFLLCLGVIATAILQARARRSSAWQQAVEVAASPAGVASPHLDRAEAFAREGRFADAMHEILLQALADIRGQHGAMLAPSLTSREILRGATLAEASRDALRLLIGRVEWTYFGLRAAASADYEACRADLHQLRQALTPA